MLYDLNVAWSPGTSDAELGRTLRFAKNLGYDVVALNHTIKDSFPTQPSPIINPIPQFSLPQPTSNSDNTVSTTAAATTTPATASLPTVLRRVTLTITDPKTTNYRLGDFARAYDLLALRPTSKDSFAWACLSSTETPALISLDMTTFLGWHIHHRTAMAAVHRGTRFEVCYAQALSPGIDARMRANFIGNVLSLIRATKGRGIVVSSEARSTLGLRGPADVINLMSVWGLGPERGTEAMGAGARAVVVNEGLKRRGFRGIVDIVRPAGPGDAMQTSAAVDGDEGKKDAGGKQGKKQNKDNNGGGQKRKSGEGAPEGTISKRQAKKMKRGGLNSAA